MVTSTASSATGSTGPAPSCPATRWPGCARPDPDSVGDLLGLGPGLTPLGDDVLAGWLAAAVASRHPALQDLRSTVALSARERTTSLSATLLACAARGEGVPEFRSLMTGVADENSDVIEQSLSLLLRVGDTSGEGLVLGAQLALQSLEALQRCERMTDVVVHVEVRRGAYADSVALLQVSRDVAAVEGVDAAQVAMATPLNIDVLTGMGFEVPDCSPNDMVVAIRLADESRLPDALAAVEAALRGGPRSAGPVDEEPPRTTTSAFTRLGGDLALVSVPGASAVVEAVDALESGRDVMVFSDNVPLEHEVALKRRATERGPARHGSRLRHRDGGRRRARFRQRGRRGAGPSVGIVAASGTGCQQLMCLLSYAGVTVAAALGRRWA